MNIPMRKPQPTIDIPAIVELKSESAKQKAKIMIEEGNRQHQTPSLRIASYEELNEWAGLILQHALGMNPKGICSKPIQLNQIHAMGGKRFVWLGRLYCIETGEAAE